MPPSRQSKHISNKATDKGTDQNAPKKSTLVTRRNAAAAVGTKENVVATASSAAVAEENTVVLSASVAAASLPSKATVDYNTTLDAATPIIDINDVPPGRKLSRIVCPPNSRPTGMGVNNTTLDAATPRIERDPNAKSFHAIVNELRSHPMAPPLNVRQRMLSHGLKP